MQVFNGKRHPARYESGVWSPAEAKYDAGKRECRAVLKALKKFRHWVYGAHFMLEIDADALVAQLNRSATDLPGALVTSWIAWIGLFDFTVKHVPREKHGAADGLSRRPATDTERVEQSREVDIDEYVQAQFSGITAKVLSTATREPVGRILNGPYTDGYEKIARYPTTLERPHDLQGAAFRAWKQKAL